MTNDPNDLRREYDPPHLLIMEVSLLDSGGTPGAVIYIASTIYGIGEKVLERAVLKRAVRIRLRLLRCPKCGYMWWYRGQRKGLFLTCPNCYVKSHKILIAEPTERDYEKWRVEV